jgi:hypothetical protein
MALVATLQTASVRFCPNARVLERGERVGGLASEPLRGDARGEVGDAAGVVTAVFEALQAFDQHQDDVAARRRPDDSAHA